MSDVGSSEAIFYCNLEFERLTGQAAGKIQGSDWKVLPGVAALRGDDTLLGEAIQTDQEYIGTFTIERDGECVNVDAWSNTIESDDGAPTDPLTPILLLRLVQTLGDSHSTGHR